MQLSFQCLVLLLMDSTTRQLKSSHHSLLYVFRNPNVEHSRLRFVFLVFGPELEVVGCQNKRYCCGLSWVQSHSREIFQFLHWSRIASYEVSNKEEDSLISFHSTFVFDCGRDQESFSDGEFGFGLFEVGVAEGCIGEAKPIGEKRGGIAVDIAWSEGLIFVSIVGSSCVFLIVVSRNMTYWSRESDR